MSPKIGLRTWISAIFVGTSPFSLVWVVIYSLSFVIYLDGGGPSPKENALSVGLLVGWLAIFIIALLELNRAIAQKLGNTIALKICRIMGLLAIVMIIGLIFLIATLNQ